MKRKNCENDRRRFFDISLGQEWNKLPAIYQDNGGLCGLVRGYLHQIQSRYSKRKETHTYQTNNQPKMCVSLEVFRKSELNTQMQEEEKNVKKRLEVKYMWSSTFKPLTLTSWQLEFLPIRYSLKDHIFFNCLCFSVTQVRGILELHLD